jgi:CheY-like chemotaxis protein
MRDQRVLVVDDHPTSRTILVRYLESLGFITREVSSGAEAIDELERADRPYRLVLMDWKMPGMDGVEASRRILASDRINEHPDIIMVTAYGREEVMEEAEAVGIKAFLVKPVSPSTLLDAILEAIGQAVEHLSHPGGTPVAQEALRGARVLLVEDNEINQQVAQELLGKAGITVSTANHGKEGLDMLGASPEAFDAVLMDIQMPIMDGYAATQEIRKDQRFQSLPVIAMTANAMASDRDKALEAGMNDHIAKPIDLVKLFEVLNRWIKVPESRHLQAADTITADPGEPVSLPDVPGLDSRGGLMRCGGNEAGYRRILARFCNTQATSPQRIQVALTSGDRATAEREAHTLVGVAGNIGAQAVQAAAQVVEKEIRQGAEPAGALAALQQTMTTLLASLSVITHSQEPAAKGTAINAAELTPLLNTLQQLLEERNAAAVGLVAQIEPQLHDTDLKNRMQTISERINDFEFEDALQLLGELRGTLP